MPKYHSSKLIINILKNTKQTLHSMKFNKWINIIKIILLKVVEELERRINARNGVDAPDQFTTTLYTSLKFIVLEQVDELVDEVIGYTKKQINELSLLIAQKMSIILASLVYVLILVGMAMFTFIFFAISLSLFLGEVLGKTYYGFLVTGGIVLILTTIIYFWGHASLAFRIKNQLLKLI